MGRCDRKKGDTGDLTTDHTNEADCNGPAGFTSGFGIWISVLQSDFCGWSVRVGIQAVMLV